MSAFTYWAFISYSRRDSRSARWLHRALETYVLPRRLVGHDTPAGPAPRRFRPIFRDCADAAAGGELHDSIERALAQSAFLIVVCSPHAVASRWVNEEIQRFRALHSDARIITVIARDSPHNSDLCFPPALSPNIHSSDPAMRSEPVAADLRRDGDGHRLVRLKVIAGMLGVGLDQLVRRDDRRRRRNLVALATASLAGMTVMTVLTLAAWIARNEAQRQRAHAEGLIEFMLTDLRKKLEPTGRLDLMDGVGAQALEYYQSQNSRELDAESLSRRARALRLMGEIRIQRGDLADALSGFQQAAASTGELLARSPHNPRMIFNHAQNVFWLGEIARQRDDLAAAERSFLEYRRLAYTLISLDPINDDWRAEMEYAQSALGVLFLEQGRSTQAILAFEQTIAEAQGIATRHPDDLNRQFELGQAHAWMADTLKKQGRLADARAHRESELAIYQAILVKDPTLRQAKYSTVVTLQMLGHLAIIEGDLARALPLFSDAVARAEDLLVNERDNMDLTSLVAIALVDRGEALLASGALSEARTMQKRASGLLAIALAHDITVAQWANYRDRAAMLEAAIDARGGDWEMALKLDQSILSGIESRGGAGINTEPQYLLERAHLQLGDDLVALGRESEGRRQWEAISHALVAPVNTYEPALLIVLKSAELRLGHQAAAQAIDAYFSSRNIKAGNLAGVVAPRSGSGHRVQ